VRTSVWIAVTLALFAGCGDKGGHPPEAHDEHGEHGEHDEHGEHGEHGEEEASGLVKLTAAQVATAKITATVVERRALSSEILATGEVVPPDDGVARIGAKLAGRVTRLTRGVGDTVARGQSLATIDSPELGRAKADYIAAATIAQVNRVTADREKALFDKKISAERDWRNADADATRARAEKEAAEVRLHTLGVTDAQLRTLRADEHYGSAVGVPSPIAGVVVERPVALGQMVEPQDTMFVVMDLRSVWVMVDVYERDLAQIAVGQGITATVAAWPERSFVGTVQSIGATVERRSRTIKVRVVLANPDGALKPGMFAKVKIAGSVGESRDGLFVAASAVQRDGDDAIVFVPVSDTEFQLRTVELGVTTGDWVELVRGVVPGERVVTTGTFILKSEARRGSFGGHEH